MKTAIENVQDYVAKLISKEMIEHLEQDLGTVFQAALDEANKDYHKKAHRGSVDSHDIFKAGAEFAYNYLKGSVITFPNGSEIHFKHNEDKLKGE